MLRLAYVFSVCVTFIFGYPNYQQEIPNGAKVPDPCTNATDDYWPMVGHLFASRGEFMRAQRTAEPGDSAFLNLFGKMFQTNNRNWTAICDMDADGDGQTNGEELGDPYCEWTINAIPYGPATGHPAICEEEVAGCLAGATRSEICPV
uniref:Temptin-like n=1 Tax=Crassostrea virginica TaxID=6565 RepID=A0A8B8ATB8_CRAVI|nr:temptin-like [Crassostrea virginica]